MTPKTPSSGTSHPGKVGKKQQQTAGRERAEQLRLEAEARARRQKGLIITVTVALVAALVVSAWIFIQSEARKDSENARGPAGLTDIGGFVVGQDDVPVTVSLYVDFQCPACKAFEAENGALLSELAAKQEIKVEYVPVSILDRFSSGTEYSTRSASAAYCVAEHDPDAFVPFLGALFENQPEEGGSGLDNEVIAQIAELIGAGDKSAQCIKDETYTDYVAKVTDEASQAGLPGTPSVRVNGTLVDDLSKQSLVDHINAAKDAAGEG